MRKKSDAEKELDKFIKRALYAYKHSSRAHYTADLGIYKDTFWFYWEHTTKESVLYSVERNWIKEGNIFWFAIYSHKEFRKPVIAYSFDERIAKDMNIRWYL